MVARGPQNSSGGDSSSPTSTTHKPLLKRLYVYLYHPYTLPVKPFNALKTQRLSVASLLHKHKPKKERSTLDKQQSLLYY